MDLEYDMRKLFLFMRKPFYGLMVYLLVVLIPIKENFTSNLKMDMMNMKVLYVAKYIQVVI